MTCISTTECVYMLLDLDWNIEKSNGKTIAIGERAKKTLHSRQQQRQRVGWKGTKCNHRLNRKMERETKMKSNNKFEVKSNTKGMCNRTEKNEQFVVGESERERDGKTDNKSWTEWQRDVEVRTKLILTVRQQKISQPKNLMKEKISVEIIFPTIRYGSIKMIANKLCSGVRGIRTPFDARSFRGMLLCWFIISVCQNESS